MTDLFATTPPQAPGRPAASNPVEKSNVPCTRPWTGKPQHQCRAGGGDASGSDDNGLSWFCAAHAPADFPGRRG